MIAAAAENFAQWRDITRGLLQEGVRPDDVLWSTEPSLFESFDASPRASISLPRSFIETAQLVARHSDSSRWHLLYRLAWRIRYENHDLIQIETDDDVRSAMQMRKAVETDIYKMRAFVRFRRTETDGLETFVAWYAPDHDTLDANERFFTARFGGMRWAILTPRKSISWDLKKLHHGPGIPRSQAPSHDELEDIFRAYYSSIYNPARLNLDAMRAQMPVRRWHNLPETQVVPALVRESRANVQRMTLFEKPGASAFVPQNASLPVLRRAVASCRACELCSRATQPVFGEGPDHARLVLVGEQPGDEEDRCGRPFVGPAGQILNAALEEAGLDRSAVYVSNAVKAFRFEERGKRRIHATPKAVHISTCRPWLEAEMQAVQPAAIICLGATAAQAVLGRSVPIAQSRGEVFSNTFAPNISVTYHPSAVLRSPDPAKDQMRQSLVQDLRRATAFI